MQNKPNEEWMIWDIDPDRDTPNYTITLNNDNILHEAELEDSKNGETYKYHEIRASPRGWEPAEGYLPCQAKLTYGGVSSKGESYEHGFCVGEGDGKVNQPKIYRYSKMPGWDFAKAELSNDERIPLYALEQILNAKTSGWLTQFENVTVIDKTDYEKLLL